MHLYIVPGTVPEVLYCLLAECLTLLIKTRAQCTIVNNTMRPYSLFLIF
uniref:Uncharacterized protein n=1 Tax=Arundo donax TaxID=35708 RepID=A0A0A8XNY1_ARUDO